MKIFRALCVGFILFVPITAWADTVTIVIGQDRPGNDYKNFWMAKADPEVCRAACLNDKKCEAWTYVKPGVHGAQARCYLKNKPTDLASVINYDFASGYKIRDLTPLQPGRIYDNVRGIGNVYTTINMTTIHPSKLDGTNCKSACAKEQRCLAWALKKRSGRLSGHRPQCLLQDSIGKPARHDNYISGVKRMAIRPMGNITTMIAKEPTNSAKNAVGQMRLRPHFQKPKGGQTPPKPGAKIGTSLDGLARPANDHCKGANAKLFKNQNELCNGLDDNCNGQIDEGVTVIVYRDQDGDGFGAGPGRRACAVNSTFIGMALRAGDCNDTNPRQNPAAGNCK